MTVTDQRFPPGDACVVPQIIRRRAREHPDRIYAVFADGETWSYGELAERVWRRANAFAKLGVGHGDRVACWLPTGRAAIETWFAVNALGATFAPLNTAYRGSLLEHALELTGKRFLVAHAELVDELSRCPNARPETIVVVGAARHEHSGSGVIGWSEMELADASCPESVDAVEPWDDMLLLFTSGTTGPSKAVRLSYLHHYTYSFAMWPTELTQDDRFLNCYPMFHNSGTCTTYTPLRMGASTGVVGTFRTDTFWEDVNSVGATVAIIFAAMANFLRKQPATPQDALTSLRYALGGPLLADHKEFARRFDLNLWTVYAMTEIPAPIRSDLNPDDHRPCGKLVDPDHFEVRIVDEHDRELPDGETGEMIVRHSRPWSLNSGYQNMPEATARAWQNGWFHTGDAFYRDDQGQYFFVDRRKDTIRRRGENISSMELEEEILSHPAVAEAACIAVPDDSGEDEIKACVVLASGSELSWPELTEYLIARLPHYMVPRYLEAYETLPRSISTKLQKHVLREHGLGDATWDREAAGIHVGRRVLEEQV